MKRRDFLQRTLAASAGVGMGLGGFPGIHIPRAYGVQTWGDYPDFAAETLLSPEKQAKNVLEVFLYGGLCPWETFYVVDEEDYGKSKNEMWWSFQNGGNSVSAVFESCGAGGGIPMLEDFAIDDNGVMVKLGPFVAPLRNRPDIRDRLRVHVISHTLEPHEAAIPLGMSGFRLGAPKLAGVGAAVQHYFQAHASENTGEPYSYVLYSPGDFPTDNLRAASSVGMHPGSSRPLSLRVAQGSTFIEALKRLELGDKKEAFDEMLGVYTAQYQQRLSWMGSGSVSRSRTFNDYAFAVETLKKTNTLQNILDPGFFAGKNGSACGDSANTNYPRMELELAAHILTRPGSQARHVTVVDGGLIPASGGGGYDTHNAHNRDSGRNLFNLWNQLTSIINAPGENDPAKLNLDETLVVVNTEFGRTPWSQNGDGRNHHPYAYTTVMFGGPVGYDQKGLVGTIDSSGFAQMALSPAETRAATLSALGIYPFAPECYAVSDVYGTGTETEASEWLKAVVLGVTE